MSTYKSKSKEYVHEYIKRFAKGKTTDSTWDKVLCQHTCCGAKNNYLHKVKCPLNRDDLDDLL